MKPRSALMIAAVLTTFVLVLVGAVINRLLEPSPAEQAAAADLAVPSIPTIDLQATTTASDAAYQQQLAEASARIEQANQQLTQAYNQLAQPAPPAANPPAPPVPPAAAPNDPRPAPAAPPAAAPPVAAPPAAAPPPVPAQISSEQAVAAAVAYLGNGEVKEVKLEREHGSLVYEVRFTNGSRVYVDPTSGRVIYARVEERDGNSGSGGGDKADEDNDDDD